jgi:multicomponent Na+:H+ antiporter subunit D
VASLEFGTVGLWLALPVVASSVLTVAYVWRAIEAAYFGPAPEPSVPGPSAWATAVVVAAAAANIYFGLQPGAPLELAASAAGALLAAPFPK